MSALKYWLWLTTRPSLKPGEAAALAERFGGPERVYFADPAEYALAGSSSRLREELEHKELDWPERILEDCARLEIRVLTMQDAEYPERLRQIDAPPAVLYVKGRTIPFDELVSVGVVGSRRPTPYGIQMAGDLGRDLAYRGGSGGLRHCPGHRLGRSAGAILAGGTVCSVLGGGIDVVYPSSSADLFRVIPQVGALVSEYPPGTATEGRHYPIRNRIISGLSLGVAAVQGGERSGTLITARTALDQNRDVFAFPGLAGDPASAGTNLLIQRGEAKLIQSAADILEEYEGLYPERAQARPAVERPLEHIVSRTETPQSRSVPAEKPVDKRPGRAYSTFEAQTEEFTDDEKKVLLTGGADAPPG